EVHIISAFSMIFSMLVVFNVLFFSSDREHMVTLPLSHWQLLSAKFWHTYMAESIMEFMVLFSMFIGHFAAAVQSFGVLGVLGPVQIAAALIGTLATPLLPLAYCTILSLVLMSVLKKVRNIKVFYHLSTVLLLVFVAIFLLSFRGMGGVNVNNYMDSLAGGTNLFLQICNILFFTVPLLGNAIGSGSLLSLILYLLGNAVVVGIMLFLGYLLYQEGLYTAGALGSQKKKADTDKLNLKSTSILRAYIKKEIKVLLRTRAYASNCFYINLLWPIGIVILFSLSKTNENIRHFLDLYREGYSRAALILLLIVIFTAFVASALNSLSSTAFTREGAHVDIIKYIPVPYETQMYAKAAVALLVTYPALILTVIIASFYVGWSVPWSLYYCLLALSALILSIVIGLSMDSAAPFTLWDDEYSALRGNLNSFFNMAVIMVLAIFVCGIAFLAFELTPLGILPVHLLILILLVILDFIAVIFGKKIILKNMEELY
ncbi:MAG: hypothetical protein J6M27_09130, partial [Lachnospiraceae bacterium]|nr:hypothetical protein [Lachnospiraceae bacterium]